MCTLQHNAKYIVSAIVIYILCQGFSGGFKGVPVPCPFFILSPGIFQSRIIKHFLIEENRSCGAQTGRNDVLLAVNNISIQNRLYIGENAVIKIDIVVHRLNQILCQIGEEVNRTAIEHHVRSGIARY